MKEYAIKEYLEINGTATLRELSYIFGMTEAETMKTLKNLEAQGQATLKNLR